MDVVGDDLGCAIDTELATLVKQSAVLEANRSSLLTCSEVRLFFTSEAEILKN